MKEEELAPLREKYGDIAIINIRGREAAFKKPPFADWESFTEKVFKDRTNKSAAIRELCYLCVLNMSREELHALFEEYPAVPAKCFDKLQDLAGADVEGEVKKR